MNDVLSRSWKSIWQYLLLSRWDIYILVRLEKMVRFKNKKTFFFFCKVSILFSLKLKKKVVSSCNDFEIAQFWGQRDLCKFVTIFCWFLLPAVKNCGVFIINQSIWEILFDFFGTRLWKFPADFIINHQKLWCFVVIDVFLFIYLSLSIQLIPRMKVTK